MCNPMHSQLCLLDFLLNKGKDFLQELLKILFFFFLEFNVHF